MRHRGLGRRSSVPAALLFGHHSAVRHRTPPGRAAPLPQPVPGRRHRPVRRVPRPDDVLHACLGVGGRCRPHARPGPVRRLLLCERHPAHAVRPLRGVGAVPHGRLARPVFRPGPHPARLRLRELGPVRGGAGHGGHVRLLPREGRGQRRPHRPGGGGQALPRPAAGALRPRSAPAATDRGGGTAAGVERPLVVRGEPRVHAGQRVRVVHLLPVQRRTAGRLGQPVVRDLLPAERHGVLLVVAARC